MRRLTEGIAVVAALAVVAAFAGCGGGGEQPELSHGEYIAQGNTICRKENERKSQGWHAVLKEVMETEREPTPQEVVEKIALPPLVEMTEELSALNPPKADRAEGEQMVAAFEKSIDDVEADPNQATEGADPIAKPKKLAGKFGFKACAGIS